MIKAYLSSFFHLIAAFVFTDFFSQQASAQMRLEVEGAYAWQIRNVNRVPAEGGTEFDLASFSRRPIFAPRYLLTWDVDSKHSIRAMIFPFQTSGSGEFSKDVVFNKTTFSAGNPTTGTYKFHSYRLTYGYLFLDSGHWQLRGGVTGKIRNAKVELRQDGRKDAYSNVGFVPLAHFNARRYLSPDWRWELDADAAAAPQGRAEDVSLMLWKTLGDQVSDQWEVGFGGRILEGGASNSRVYSFAWVNFLTASVAYRL